MKKIILNVAVMTALVLSYCFYSCNNEDVINQKNSLEINNELKLLSDQLNSYNNDFSKENKCLSLKTRRHNTAWWVLLTVADYEGGKYGAKIGGWFGGVHGAVSGALAGGIFLSGCYAWASNQVPIQPNINTKIYHLENEYNYVGEAHNKILGEILQYKYRYTNNGVVNFDLLYNDILNKCKSYDITANEIYYMQKNKQQFIEIHKDFKALTTQFTDETIIINKVFDNMITKYPESKEDIKITQNYVLNATKINDIEVLSKYANGYEKIILESKIAPELKTDLLSSISLGKNSQAFWMESNN